MPFAPAGATGMLARSLAGCRPQQESVRAKPDKLAAQRIAESLGQPVIRSAPALAAAHRRGGHPRAL